MKLCTIPWFDSLPFCFFVFFLGPILIFPLSIFAFDDNKGGEKIKNKIIFIFIYNIDMI